MSNPARKLRRAAARLQETRMLRVLQHVPKPPRDAQGCACKCAHKPDRGPCPKYIDTGGERCAVCDHSAMCHRRKGEPPPKDWNAPFRLPGAFVRVLPPSALTCQTCKGRLMRCKCGAFIPFKQITDGFHIAKCPACGYFDELCPKAKL